MKNSIALQITKSWEEYALLDSGSGKRLERFGKYILSRPDPQAIWLPKLPVGVWETADAVFEKDKQGKENWKQRTGMPEKWEMQWENVTFYAKLSPFKHTGVFPEQASQWTFLRDQILKKVQDDKPFKLLNLFAYTGVASLVAASAGAEVTHVDSSSAAINWAKDNQTLSGLSEKPIRWILEDVMKFVEREVSRGNTYDGIIMDPPIYGHGVKNEVWDFMKDFPRLVEQATKLLSPDAAFLLVNAYAISSSSLMLGSVLEGYLEGRHGTITTGELALEEKESSRLLSTGIYGLWSTQ